MGEDTVMYEVITAISTNIFRAFIIKRFMSLFFDIDIEQKWKGNITYFIFVLGTVSVHLAFHYPPANILTNIFLIYLITRLYPGTLKKRVSVTLLIYGINMFCDILSMYSFNNYIVGEAYNEIASYITVFLIGICEFFIERFLVKRRKEDFVPLYWNILITIPIISIILLTILIMNNLNNRVILVSVSAGILFINLIIFYLYDVLLGAYLQLEENALFERQIDSYANQLNVLMSSEESVRALQHDMKHHLNELLAAAEKKDVEEIKNYIYSMQMYMKNPYEHVSSGNEGVDSLLNYMLNKAKSVLDQVEYKVSVPQNLGIRPFDFNVVMGNLLENAILASSKSERKWLSLVLSYEKGVLFIHIQNTYDEEIQKKGERYLSTKQDGKNHGIGLQNVKKVIDGYSGILQIKDENRIFDVKVMLYTT